jgi:hypothetical protein
MRFSVRSLLILMFGVAINCVTVKVIMRIDQPPNSLPAFAYPALALASVVITFIAVFPLVLSLNRDND